KGVHAHLDVGNINARAIRLHTNFDVVVHHALDWDQYLHGLALSENGDKTISKPYTSRAERYKQSATAIQIFNSLAAFQQHKARSSGLYHQLRHWLKDGHGAHRCHPAAQVASAAPRHRLGAAAGVEPAQAVALKVGLAGVVENDRAASADDRR